MRRIGVILAVSSPAMVFAVMGAACVVGALLVTPLRDAVTARPVESDEGAIELEDAYLPSVDSAASALEELLAY